MILMMIMLTMTMTVMMMMDIYIYIYGYTDKLSIYLSIDKPTSLYPMYHPKKTPKSYPRHSCCCLAKSAVIVDENSS